MAAVWLSLVLLAGAIEFAKGAQLVSQLTPGTAISAVGGGDSSQPIVSPDGRYVLFASTANNLVAGPGGQAMLDYVPAQENVFLRDRQAGTTMLVSINAAGTGGGNGDSWPSAISTNGQYALFESTASDLVAGDTNGAKDIFIRDVIHGTTTLVSVSTNGSSGNGESREATMTPDGRYVAFVSAATNLVAGDSNGIPDIFVRDMQAGTTILASPGARAVPQTQATPYTKGSSSEFPIISVDGRYVAFYSTATNLVGGHTLGEVYVRDPTQGVTIWASSNARSVVTTPASANYAMSTNGQFIAYESSGGTPGGVVFLYNVATGATHTIFTNGAVPTSLDLDARNVDISGDGSFVAFTATNGPAASSSTSVELWNGFSNTTSLVSGGTVGAQPDYPRIDQSGRYVAFFDNEASLTTNSDGNFHVYLRDTVAGTVQLVDVGTNGAAPISFLMTPFHFSTEGDLVAFECFDGAMSSSPNKLDVFARDLVANTTEVISTPAQALASSTAFGSSGLSSSSISSNGQYAAFYSDAAGLAANAAWGVRNIFVHDFVSGSNVLVSVSTDGLVAGNSGSFEPAMSGDGRYVAFSSYATNLVANDTNNAEDVFVRDLQAGATTLVSVGAGGLGEGNGNSYCPQISANGRYVLFFSAASNLVAGARNEFFWRDLQAGTTYAIGATNIAVMTPDGSNVVFAAGAQLHLWQAQNQSNTTVVSTTAPILDVAVSPDGTRAAFGTASAIYTADLVQRTSAQLGLASRVSSQARFQFSGNSLCLANLVTPATESNQVYLYNFQSATNALVSQSYASGVGGKRTNLPSEEGQDGANRTDSAQNTVESESEAVKFPKVIRHRKAECKIYGKKPHYPFYRVAWYVTGQRRIKQFATYSKAKSFADELVKDLAKGSQRTALTPAQAVDALAAVERLQGHYQRTGRTVSLLRAVSEYVEVAEKLNGRTPVEAVEGYLSTVASVTRKDVAEAVEEFIKASEPLTKASDGQRAQLSAKYAYNRAIMLRRFGKALPGHAVCDLSKDHIDAVLTSNPVAEFAAKTGQGPLYNTTK